MSRTIKILNVESSSDAGGCGSSTLPSSPAYAAGIDTDIFEADTLAMGGERFWEAFWRTQHTYGGVSEGQSLAEIFSRLEEPVLEKLASDMARLCLEAGLRLEVSASASTVNAAAATSALGDEEKDDVLGMVMFLLTIERADPAYSPFEIEGYEGALARFAAAVGAEQQRRQGAG